MPAPVPLPAPDPAPPGLTPPGVPAPAVSIPYYARVQNRYGVGLPDGFVVEWYPDHIEFGPLTFSGFVGPAGNAPGEVVAVILDAHHQPLARLALESADGKLWLWGLDTDTVHAVGTLERR